MECKLSKISLKKIKMSLSVSVPYVNLLEMVYLTKGLYTLDIFAHNIAIKIKRYCDKKIILNHGCLKANQDKLLNKP